MRPYEIARRRDENRNGFWYVRTGDTGSCGCLCRSLYRKGARCMIVFAGKEFVSRALDEDDKGKMRSGVRDM